MERITDILGKVTVWIVFLAICIASMTGAIAFAVKVMMWIKDVI